MLDFSGVLAGDRQADVARRGAVIATISFLTLVDLFGAQALLPQIIRAYNADPAVAGLAVNAATLGMAIAGLTIAYFADRIDRRRGIWLSLAMLSIPTILLSVTSDIWLFMALRVVQGALMATAFTLTMTYLSERCHHMAIGGALAAYVTGNVASNLFGRLAAVAVADAAGLSGSFVFFAVLNLVGAGFAFLVIGRRDDQPPNRGRSALAAWAGHLADPALRAVFGIGFLILFMFVGVFTYVNLYLVDQLGVPAMSLGFVYLVFLPAIVTTPFAGSVVRKTGPRRSLLLSLAAMLAGLALAASSQVLLVLLGLAVIGCAIFFAQASATGHVSSSVSRGRAQANGLYLTSYYTGGLAGAFLLGQMQKLGGWHAAAAAIAFACVLAMALALALPKQAGKAG
jgi:predicted MFS family arabinose efflux permease